MTERSLPCPVCGQLVSETGSLCPACGCRYHLEATGAKADGMACFSCGFQTDEIAAACPQCGAQYLIECPKCGNEYPPNERFCPKCRHDRLQGHQERFLDQQLDRNRPATGRFSLRMFMAMTAAMLIMAVLIVLTSGFDIMKTNWLDVVVIFVVAMLGSLLVAGIGLGMFRRPKPYVSQKMIEVYRSFELASADHLASLLQSEGIQAHSYNRYSTSILHAVMPKGYRILVPREHVQESLEIMKAFGFSTELDLDGFLNNETQQQPKEGPE